jgi:hypothetical protein
MPSWRGRGSASIRRRALSLGRRVCFESHPHTAALPLCVLAPADALSFVLEQIFVAGLRSTCLTSAMAWLWMRDRWGTRLGG